VSDDAPYDEPLDFERTVCACRKCRTWCEHMPGHLVPGDLGRLIPPGVDPFEWAEEHLRASYGALYMLPTGPLSIPSLVPAKQANGHCHWYEACRCAVHDRSPFGCAYHDQHMTTHESERRAMVARNARHRDFARNGLYARIWRHLAKMGLVYRDGVDDRRNALDQLHSIRRQEEAAAKHEGIASRRRQKKAQRAARKRSRR
jgi:hypothetical protein